MRRNLAAVVNLLQPFDDYLFARRDTLLYHLKPAELLPQVDGAHRDFIVRTHHCHLRLSLRLQDRGLWNQQGVVNDSGGGANLRIEAGPQNVIRVAERRLDLNGAGLDIHLSIHVIDFAEIFIDGAIGQNHLEARAVRCTLVRILVDLLSHAQILLLADGKFDFDRIKLGDRGQQRGGRDEVADLGGSNRGDPIDRRYNLSPTEVELRRFDRSLRGFDLGVRRASGLGLIVEFLLRHDSLLVQRGVTIQVQLVLFGLRLGLREIRIRLIKGRLILPRIDLKKDSAGAHRIAVAVVLPYDVSRNLW